jgi:acetyl esterase/lipase
MKWARLLSLSLALLATGGLGAAEPSIHLLWPEGAPGALGDAARDKPRLLVYLPEKEKANGSAIVICPGGGYGGLAMGHEGHEIAAWANSFGAAGLILDYRHRGKGYGHPAPLLDAQRALRMARQNSDSWGIDPARLGIMGFSAGGHLASSAGTHFDAGTADAKDPIDRQSCRPDFLILCYAVIAFDEPYTHRGSQRNLLGADADKELVRSMSSEKQVSDRTPPTFLWHTTEDTGVPPQNSLYFYLAMKKAGVPAELHIFEKGRHGVGLARNIPGTSAWPDRCVGWLRVRGVLPTP